MWQPYGQIYFCNFIPRPLAFQLQFHANPKQGQYEKPVVFRFIPHVRNPLL